VFQGQFFVGAVKLASQAAETADAYTMGVAAGDVTAAIPYAACDIRLGCTRRSARKVTNHCAIACPASVTGRVQDPV